MARPIPALILGVSFGHESGVAVVDAAGEPLFALSEERLTRVKMQAGVPWRCLEEVKTRFADALGWMPIAVAGLPPLRDHWLRWQRCRFCQRHGLQHSPDWRRAMSRALMRMWAPSDWRAPHHAAWRSVGKGPVIAVDHHEAHAASAYYHAGHDRALIATIDGEGNQLGATLYAGENGRLRRLAWRYFTDFPVGKNYEIVTAVLGFNPERHCGKVAGLAAHGRPNPECRRALETFLARIWNRGGYPYHRMGREDMLRYGAMADTGLEAFPREDLAHAIQALTEEAALDWVRRGMDLFPSDTVALAGGTFANVRVNQRVKELGFAHTFVQPGMTDVGLSLGAALAVRARDHALTPRPLKHVFLGPAFSEGEALAALRQAGVDYSRPDAMSPAVADLLARRKVVARCDGPMEFGPRALGNRSILCHAGDPTVNDWLNQRLQRTEFMPFAPVTPAEQADEYYEGMDGLRHAARFMTVTVNCTPHMKAVCPAAVHVDGTARPQLADAKTTPELYAILRAYKKQTGIATVINTSFNMHEEPIVATPAQALEAYEQARLDALALGPFLVERPS